MVSKVVAIIGASPDPIRYSNRAVRAYASKGYTVYPVNPNYQLIEGLKCYSKLADLPTKPGIVSVYVNPSIGLLLAKDIIKVKPGIIYLNPGSESPELFKMLRDAGLNVVYRCSIRALGIDPEDLAPQ